MKLQILSWEGEKRIQAKIQMERKKVSIEIVGFLLLNFYEHMIQFLFNYRMNWITKEKM